MKQLIAILVLPALAWSQDPPRPVSEAEYDDYDVESMKAGEWTLHETVRESPGDDGKVEKSGYRVRRACVKADKERVWIESSGWPLEAKEADEVGLCEVDRKTRKVLKAWLSEKGAVAKVAEVKPAEGKAPPEEEERGNGASSEQVVQEKLKIGTRELSCNVVKLEEFHPDKNFKTIPTRTNVWFSIDVPFRLRVTDAGVRKKNLIPETWSKEFKVSQALVKFETAGGDANGKDTTTLVDFGKDAKATVKVK